MKYSDFIGNKDIVHFIKTAVNMDRVAHAYILTGPKLSGKNTLAKIFAKTVMCSELNEQQEFCGKCRSCIQIEGNNNPDVKILVQEKENSIGIDEIRLQINNDVIIKPYANDRKIYIVPNADKMTEQAQNVLLKTIEEPPKYVVIFLLVENEKKLIPTILSRCVNLYIKSVKDVDIIDYILRNDEIDQYDAKIAVAFAQGNVGKAKELIDSDEFKQIRINIVKILENIQKTKIIDINTLILSLIGDKKNSKSKAELNEILDLFTIWFRDVLVYKCTSKTNKIIFMENINSIKEYAKIYEYSAIERVINHIDYVKKGLAVNVTEEALFEGLLLKIKENIND